MEIKKTEIPDLLVLEPKVWGDERGYFFESYNKDLFSKNGLEYHFIQDNEAKSRKGVLRGLHYQLSPFGQTKLVRVVQGEVLDVAIDIREKSPTYGQSFQIKLSAENKKQLLVPKGFAHGYLTLSETAIFCYKCDALYHREMEAGIAYNSPGLAINWGHLGIDFIISAKDQHQPIFGKHKAYVSL